MSWRRCSHTPSSPTLVRLLRYRDTSCAVGITLSYCPLSFISSSSSSSSSSSPLHRHKISWSSSRAVPTSSLPIPSKRRALLSPSLIQTLNPSRESPLSTRMKRRSHMDRTVISLPSARPRWCYILRTMDRSSESCLWRGLLKCRTGGTSPWRNMFTSNTSVRGCVCGRRCVCGRGEMYMGCVWGRWEEGQ